MFNCFGDDKMMELLIVGICALLIAFVTYHKELLSFWGTVSVLVMLLIIDVCGKWQMVMLIVWAFVSLSIVDKIFAKKIENSINSIHEKSGKRVASQVWINGGAAIVSIILFGITGRLSFMMGYIVAIAESYADSLASDIGVMSSKHPIDICSFRPLTNGLSGGISLLGSCASFVGIVIYTMLLYIMINVPLSNCLLLVFLPVVGCILDSVLGSKMQVKYICPKCKIITEKRQHCDKETQVYSGFLWMDNSAVNLISNIVTCILGIFCFEVIF